MSASDGSLVRAIRGPVTLITVGGLFALNNFTPYRFDQTWPVILIVFGLLSLLRRGTEYSRFATPGGRAGPSASPSAAPPWYNNQASAGYRESRYQQPPPENAGTAKGGFGTSAPLRSSGDAGGNPPGGGAA